MNNPFCSKCGETNPEKFYSSKKSFCKKCRIEQQAKYASEHREERKLYERQRRINKKDYITSQAMFRQYGITLSEYNNILVKQNGVCAICKNHELAGRRLAVDHDHRTGKVRSLLCTKCNTALGAVNDNPELLYLMIEYLANHNV